MLARENFGERFGEDLAAEADVVVVFFGCCWATGIPLRCCCCTLIPIPPWAFLTGLLKVEFSLIRLRAEGEGKLVSLLPEATTLLPASLLPLPADRPELNPLELEVRFPRPFSLYCWYRLGAGS